MKIRKLNEMNTPKYGIVKTDFKPSLPEGFDKRVWYLTVDDWYSIYVDGNKVSCGHDIRPLNLLELAEKYNFTVSDVYYEYIDDEDTMEYMDSNGDFPDDIEDLPFYKLNNKR